MAFTLLIFPYFLNGQVVNIIIHKLIEEEGRRRRLPLAPPFEIEFKYYILRKNDIT